MPSIFAAVISLALVMGCASIFGTAQKSSIVHVEQETVSAGRNVGAL